MLILIGLMVVGFGVGYAFRNQKNIKPGNIVTVLIWLLLLILGIEVGQNQEIVRKFHLLGFDALIIAFLTVLGSVTGAWLLWRKSTK